MSEHNCSPVTKQSKIIFSIVKTANPFQIQLKATFELGKLHILAQDEIQMRCIIKIDNRKNEQSKIMAA